MPSASATASLPWIARQARPVFERSRLSASSTGPRRRRAARSTRRARPKWPMGGVDDHAGGEAALRLVLAAEVDDDEVQRQRRYREVEAAQAQARQAEDQAEQRADRGGGGQRDPARRAELLEQDAGGEGAGGEQPGVAERDLTRIAGEQHQRHRADRPRAAPGWRGRAEAGRRGTGSARARRPGSGEPRLLRARVEKREVLARSACGSSRDVRGRSYAVELFARAEQAPGPHDEHREQHGEGHHVGQERVDVDGSAALRPPRRSSEPRSAPARLSSPPTSAAGNAFRPIDDQRWSSPASQAMSMPAMPAVKVASPQASA